MISAGTDALTRLKEILAEVADISRAVDVLVWDQETYMPAGGVRSRSLSLATLGHIAHDRFTSPEVGALLSQLEERNFDYDSDEGALVRVTRRDYDLEVRIPSELVAEAARAASEAQAVWRRAREDGDWAAFAPHLARNVDINRRIADALGWEVCRYDALLGRFEPGMTRAQLELLFGELREAIVPLVRAIADRAHAVDDSPLYGEWDERAQVEFGVEVIKRFGFDFERGRQDYSAHPFSIGIASGDVRITTRVSRTFLGQGMFGTMHESGHGMYAQGHAPELEGTPLWGGASPGVHESQSRLWENLVGRSHPFWQHFLPVLQRFFPGKLDRVGVDGFYRAVNKVQPSLIRVEADEVTYNLHVLLRFELENDLLDDRLRAEDVPEAWNAKVREYLGIEVPNDRQGALQDIHWSGLSFATFPSYTIGNVIGAQLMERVREAIPDLDAQIGAGQFAALHGWLRDQLYRHGRKYTPNELLERITGRPLTPGPWIAYVRRKFGEIYQLS